MNCYLYLSAGGGGRAATYRTIWISSGLALSLLIVATLALVRNFVMPWAVDGTVPRARIPVLPRIPLYCKGDLTTKKFIHTVDWYVYFHKDTHRSICPRGQMISPKNPTNITTAGIKLRLISGLILRKQCSYRMSKALPPSTYIMWMSCPTISAHMIMGWSLISILLSGGKICSFVVVCKQPSMLCNLSPWKSQYLFLFLESGAPDIG
ncbi:hypothetical protein Tco_1178047, partial [Tanacetum coccineum]